MTKIDYRFTQSNLGLSEAAKTVDGAVPIEQGGTGATTAEAAREKLGLGAMAVEGGEDLVRVLSSGHYNRNVSLLGNYPNIQLESALVSMATLGRSVKIETEGRSTYFAIRNGVDYAGQMILYISGAYKAGVFTLYSTANTTVDANGFVKKASPIVQLFGDGSCAPNDEAEGVTSERVSEGVYRLSGSIMGLCSDAAWHIEVPTDENKRPLVWVDYEIEPTGDVIVKTYYRKHPPLPFTCTDRKEFSDIPDGTPSDIPAGRWVDLRVQVYAE